MVKRRERDDWLDDYSIVLRPDEIRRRRSQPEFEAFTGAKWPALLLLLPIAAVAGAAGGLLASAAAWRRIWPALLVLILIPAGAIAIRRLTIASFGRPIAYLAGWCMFFGVLTGLFTMWGAQLGSAGWAYGVAGGLGFFLLGITGAGVEPPNAKANETWFLTSSIMFPVSVCAAVWLYRHGLLPGGLLGSAAMAGAIAALPFMGVTMALYMKVWDPRFGVDRLTALYLHHEKFAAEAIPLLDRAIQSAPNDLEFLNRRALAHALVGAMDKADGDWAQLNALAPHSIDPLIGKGWYRLRTDRSREAAELFEEALRAQPKSQIVLIGLANSRLRLGDPRGAVEAIEAIPLKERNDLAYIALSEAQKALGKPKLALDSASYAIDEIKTIHGRAWLARGDALAALGKIDLAAKDYNKALLADEEIGVAERAMEGLATIARPVTDEEDDE